MMELDERIKKALTPALHYCPILDDVVCGERLYKERCEGTCKLQLQCPTYKALYKRFKKERDEEFRIDEFDKLQLYIGLPNRKSRLDLYTWSYNYVHHLEIELMDWAEVGFYGIMIIGVIGFLYGCKKGKETKDDKTKLSKV